MWIASASFQEKKKDKAKEKKCIKDGLENAQVVYT